MCSAPLKPLSHPARPLFLVPAAHRRYSKSPAFFGIGLMNEPNADGVSLPSLMKYYLLGYAIVRRYSPCAYVGIMPRIGRDVAEFRNFMTDPIRVRAPAPRAPPLLIHSSLLALAGRSPSWPSPLFMPWTRLGGRHGMLRVQWSLLWRSNKLVHNSVIKAYYHSTLPFCFVPKMGTCSKLCTVVACVLLRARRAQFQNTVIEVHYYNVFEPKINTVKNVKRQISFTPTERLDEIRSLERGNRAVIIGERAPPPPSPAPTRNPNPCP